MGVTIFQDHKEPTDKLLRVVFFQLGPGGLSFIPTVNCSDFFADVELNFSLLGLYVCPDVEQLELRNQEYGIVAEIYPCEQAASVGYSPAYGNQSCSTYEETQESFNERPY